MEWPRGSEEGQNEKARENTRRGKKVYINEKKEKVQRECLREKRGEMTPGRERERERIYSSVYALTPSAPALAPYARTTPVPVASLKLFAAPSTAASAHIVSSRLGSFNPALSSSSDGGSAGSPSLARCSFSWRRFAIAGFELSSRARSRAS